MGSLTEARVDLLQWIVDDVWNVSIPKSSLPIIQRSGIRWAILPTAAMKHGRELATPRQDQRGSDGRVRWRLRFYPDVSFDEALATIAASGLEAIAPNEQAYGGLLSIEVWALPGSIDGALARDPVSWVAPTSRPKVATSLATQTDLGIDVLQGAPRSLTGAGVAVGVWDETQIDTHADFGARLTNIDGAAPSATLNHSTHVAGIIGGDSTNDATGAAEGMAPGVTLEGHNWDNDLVEMMTSTTRLSNHSYGPDIGWTLNTNVVPNVWTFGNNQDLFGDYDDDSRDMDVLVTNFNRTIVFAAGNDRDDVGPAALATQPRDCTQGGLGVDANCITAPATAKNVITVGATNRLAGMTAFSSFGPTDDGRIKPDLVAPGLQINSTNFGGGYTVKSGTSMATPAITGGIAILRERATQLGLNLRPSSYKALLVQSARDVAGTNAGPDYQSGWGIPDFAAAEQILSGPAGPCILEVTVGPGGGISLPVVVSPGQATLRVTLAWDDPAPFIIGLDAMLTSDLDLVLIDPAGGLHGPWILDPAQPGQAATSGPTLRDRRNNVEQVEVASPQAGQWIALVTVARMPLFTTQVFSLARVSLLDTIDGDQFGSCVDNCPFVANNDQLDLTGDGLGDACDPDDDDDGVDDTADNCPRTANPDQINTDTDSDGDACDPDDDDDGVLDGVDNCRVDWNPKQENSDSDSLGDACDVDDDNDGVPDTHDNCRTTANPDQANHDLDKLGDACDPDDDNDCVGDTHDNCVFVPNCNFCSARKDPGLCSDPCIGARGTLTINIGRFLNFCTSGGGRIDPKCMIDGCPFPDLEVRKPGDLRARFGELLATPAGKETGIRMLPNGSVKFPAGFDKLDVAAPNAAAPMRFTAMSLAGREFFCAGMFDGIVGQANAAAAGERICRETCQAHAASCQADGDGDGAGDACDP